MKKYWLFLIFFAFAIAACDDKGDVAPDTTAPVIAITSPVANSSFLVVDEIELRANVTSNKEVEQVRVFLSGTDGNRRQIDEVDIDFVNDDRYNNLYVNFFLAEGSSEGIYTMIVEAHDEQQYTSESAVSINVQAPDLDEAGLHTALADKPPFKIWISYNGSYLDADVFEKGLFHLIDTDDNLYVEENEINQFAQDFDIEKNIYNKMVLALTIDGLGPEALNIGLRDAKLFNDWDSNNDGELAAKEFTGGVFSRWDDNENGMLSRGEYEARVYKYFIP